MLEIFYLIIFFHNNEILFILVAKEIIRFYSVIGISLNILLKIN